MTGLSLEEVAAFIRAPEFPTAAFSISYMKHTLQNMHVHDITRTANGSGTLVSNMKVSSTHTAMSVQSPSHAALGVVDKPLLCPPDVPQQ